MNKPKDMLTLLYHKADHFIQRTPLRYFDVTPFDLPDIGGIYIISLKESDGTEAYLSINFTKDLRHEIITKREVFLATFKGNNIKFIKDRSPRFVKHSESLQHLRENTLIRFVVETDLKEQSALTAVVSAMLRPWSNGN